MSMMSPRPAGTTHRTQHTLAVCAAWVSLVLPIVSAAWMMFAQPTHFVPPEYVYWGMFACGVISLIAGCLALSTIGRRIDWMILTPAILGIVFSAILSYICLGFGVLGTEPPNWNQMRGSQANPPVVRHG